LESDSRPRHFVGGYFLARTTARPIWLPAQLPQPIVSASSCMVDMLPDLLETPGWAGGKKSKWENRPGIEQARLQEMLLWVDEKLALHQIEWGSLFLSADISKAFVALFGVSTENLILIGIGLPEKYIPVFEENERSLSYGQDTGVNRMIRARLPFESGGELQGYEVLGWEMPNFHSWLCYGFYRYGYEKLGIRPNSHGFIANLEEAERLSEYARRTDLPVLETVPTETQPWLPWLITRYPLGDEIRDALKPEP